MFFFTYPFLITNLFLFNHRSTANIYTHSLHDALPISTRSARRTIEIRWPNEKVSRPNTIAATTKPHGDAGQRNRKILRSEEHTSELQSQSNLVCRLLIEK